jgi:hypothetical protein
MTWIASARLALVVLAAGLVAGCGQIVNPPGGHPTPAATSPSARRPSPTPSAPPQYVESTRQFDLKMAEGRGLEPRGALRLQRFSRPPVCLPELTGQLRPALVTRSNLGQLS